MEIINLNKICGGCAAANLGTKLDTLEKDLADGKAYSGELLTEEEINTLNNICPVLSQLSLGTYINGVLEASKNGTEAEELTEEQIEMLNNQVCGGFTQMAVGSKVQEFVEEINDGPTPVEKVTLTYDLNGGTKDGSGTYSEEVDKGTTVDLSNYDASSITAPSGKEFDGFTTVKDDDTTKITSIKVDANTTIYVLWKDVTPTIVPWELTTKSDTILLKSEVDVSSSDKQEIMVEINSILHGSVFGGFTSSDGTTLTDAKYAVLVEVLSEGASLTIYDYEGGQRGTELASYSYDDNTKKFTGAVSNPESLLPGVAVRFILENSGYETKYAQFICDFFETYE